MKWIEPARGMACFHGESWYKCPHCGMAFEFYQAVYEDRGIKKTDEKGVYVCSCGKKFMLC